MTGISDLVGRARRALGRLRRNRKRLAGATPLASDRRMKLLTRLDTWTAPAVVPAMPNIRVAVAAGDRIRTGLAWEWSQVDLRPTDWQRELAARPVHLVLLEVSHGGIPGWGDDWTSSPLDELLAWAAAGGVPVVAWVTSDFDDVEASAPWMERVRHVFLLDDRHLDKWRTRWPQARIDVLGPAAQPRLHNPRVGGSGRRRDAAACVILHGASDKAAELAELDHALFDVWPVDERAATELQNAPLSASMVTGRRAMPPSPALSWYRVLAELGAADDELSWTVLEASSALTAVVVEASSIDRIPPDLRELVSIAADGPELRLELAARMWQEELRDREAVSLGRMVHRSHSFGHRAEEIIHVAGVKGPTRARQAVSMIVPTNRPNEIENVLANVGRQAYLADGGGELVLVLHGFDLPSADIDARARDVGIEHVTVIRAHSSLTLGACMNLGVDASNGGLIAKLDDDNFYGRHYLTDLVAAYDYTDAGIVGKWAHYVWLRSSGAVVLRFAKAEHRYERLVQGGSLVFKGDVVRHLRFGNLPRGVDTDILNRAKAAGVKTYSGDRFNYVSVRGPDRHAHTWNITDTAMLNRSGSLVFYGDPRQHVEV